MSEIVRKEKKKRREELKELIESQQQLKDLLRDVEQKIYELEGIYLEETPMGNILKGWEIDGKPLSNRPRTVDEKERLISNSSYRVYMEGKLSLEEQKVRKYEQSQSYQPKKKARRSSSSIKKEGLYEEWENDY
jgi:hypothetical protein